MCVYHVPAYKQRIYEDTSSPSNIAVKENRTKKLFLLLKVLSSM